MFNTMKYWWFSLANFLNWNVNNSLPKKHCVEAYRLLEGISRGHLIDLFGTGLVNYLQIFFCGCREQVHIVLVIPLYDTWKQHPLTFIFLVLKNSFCLIKLLQVSSNRYNNNMWFYPLFFHCSTPSYFLSLICPQFLYPPFGLFSTLH